MPIAAAFTTTEAASLQVEAMDHLEHSTFALETTTRYIHASANIASTKDASPLGYIEIDIGYL